MKIGWLVWSELDTEHPEFWTDEPPPWLGRIVQIVFAVIER